MFICFSSVHQHLSKNIKRAVVSAIVLYNPFAIGAWCGIQCSQTVDYEHAQSSLSFSRIFFEDLSEHEKASNGHLSSVTSRHRYDVKLTQQGNTLSVFDHLGIKHNFTKEENGTLTTVSAGSGSLIREADQYEWTNSNSETHTFQGSFLTTLSTNSGETLSISYANQKIHSVTDELGNSLKFLHSETGPTVLLTPEGEEITLSDLHCPLNPNEALCDSSKNPYQPPDLSSHGPFVSWVDIRPQTCESYFVEYFGTERGTRIEDGLTLSSTYHHMESTVRSFPIVDFIDDDRLIAVRSRDLTSSSFNDPSNPNALLYRINRDAREMHDSFIQPLAENGFVSTTENGITTTIHNDGESQHLVLQLLIRDNIASPSHWEQIALARENLARNYQITLEVIIIP